MANTLAGMEYEYRRLNAIRCLLPSMRVLSATQPANKFKNRLVNILPYESTRVVLEPEMGPDGREIEGSDYINASWVDSYRQRRAFIATQGPLAETTEDFWRMLWESGAALVVMLTKLRELNRVLHLILLRPPSYLVLLLVPKNSILPSLTL